LFNNVNQIDFGGGLGLNTLAETTWFFNPTTNALLECDMRFSNSFVWHTGTGPPPPSQFDWWSVATHEHGHCKGLGHEDTILPRPVMFSTFAPGEMRREPTADDLAGCFAIYDPPPPGGGQCDGSCGGQAPSGCWCDESCNSFGDCCSEVCTDCPNLNFCGPTPTPCDNAVTIPPSGGVFTGSTTGSDTLSGSCGGGATGPEKVYQWSPDISGTATIETCGTGTDYDTVVYMRSGDCEAGTEISCNDDACANSTGSALASRITPTVTAGQTYFIIVDGFGSSSGNFTLFVIPPNPPPIPDVKANGSDGPVTIPQGDNLIVTISLDPVTHNGEAADWWISANSPFGTFWFTLGSGWVFSGVPISVFGGPLFSFSSFTILQISNLPVGVYTFSFGVDLIPNGTLDLTQFYNDSVEVNIE